MKDIKLVVSVDRQGSQKVKVAEVVSSFYASLLTDAITQHAINHGDYVKVTVETEEK